MPWWEAWRSKADNVMPTVVLPAGWVFAPRYNEWMICESMQESKTVRQRKDAPQSKGGFNG